MELGTYQSNLLGIRSQIEAMLANVDNMLNEEEKKKQALVRKLENQADPDGRCKALIEEACRLGKIKESELLSESRKQTIVLYRRILCYILSDYLRWKQQKIVDKLNYKNHATVIHHRDIMRYWMANPKGAQENVISNTQKLLKMIGVHEL